MKKGFFKRALPALLTLVLVLSMVPASVFAATEVQASPGSDTLSVEYFNSTLYNWDEEKANEAAKAADLLSSGTPTYTQATSVYYSDFGTTGTDTSKTASDYFYFDGSDYYPVYYTLSTSGWLRITYSYTFYYLDNSGNYNKCGSGSTTSPYRDTIDVPVYTSSGSSATYEGKGLYFTSSNGKPTSDDDIPLFSKWSGSNQNYYIYSGLTETKLADSTNKPFSNENVNAPRLFDTTGNDYTDVYNFVGVPYVYDSETGYYTLDSDAYAVYFAGGNPKSGTSESDLYNMLIADKPAAFTGYSGSNDTVTGFQPFKAPSSTTTTAYKSFGGTTTAYRLSDKTYGFGMVTSVGFQMTDDGKTDKGDDIIFQFSGDDDVWVYVDGVLALDIGGTHDAVLGQINFTTGDVTLSSPGYGKIGDKRTDTTMTGECGATLSQTNLYESLGTTLTGFSAQGTHTLTIYYMDRGQGRTNCLIQFNLPQRDTLTVTKNITQSKDKDGAISDLTEAEQENINGVDFGFTLYRDGKIVPNKTFYITYTEAGETKQVTSATNASGHFTLKNGQTARFNGEISEEGTSLYVVEDTLNSSAYTLPEYSYSTNISDSNVTVEAEASGYTSMKLTLVGSNTTTDSVAITCTNYLSNELPNPSIYPADDLIVVDYGLPISISTDQLLSNDTRRGESFEIIDVSITGQYGTAVMSDDGKTITYTLTDQLNGIEELTYTAQASNKDGETFIDTGTIKIIPATSMYYEENFGSMVTYSNGAIQWVAESDGKSYGPYQETDFAGSDGANATSTYGTDTAYLSNAKDSFGTSMHASAKGYAAQFTYDFTGTGTAIYSRISLDSAYICVKITNKDTNAIEQWVYIDTRVIGNVAVDEYTTLYNIPVYYINELVYGEHTVTVTIYKENTPVQGWYDEESGTYVGTGSGAEFYLDGIRIYNPLVGNAIAESAYAADGETNTMVINIRDKVLADYDYGYIGDSFATLTDVDDGIIDVEDYASIGPNTELYLDTDTGYTVSFYLLNWDAKDYQLYIGMKAPGGKGASIDVNGHVITLNNSADCYYNISDYITVEQIEDEETSETYNLGSVTISGYSDLVSLTNIKVVGVEELNLGYSEDIQDDVNYSIDRQVLYLLPTTFAFSDDVEEEEIVIFTPESIKTACNYATRTKKATVTVATSKDVAYITVNGVKVNPKTLGKGYMFTYSATKVASGTVFEIVAYNADGVASETYTVRAGR